MAPVLVAIVGGSGSGKTWLAQRLQALFARCAARLSLDDFYLDRSHLSAARRARLNFDHPRAIDWQCLECALQELSAGRQAQIPDYDFASHCRRRRMRVLQPKPLILLDGLWLLRRRALRRLFRLSIYLDCPTRTRLRRRLARDVLSRGRMRTSVCEQFWATVEPMHARYVAPQSLWAELVFIKTCTSRDIQKLAERIGQLLGGDS